MTPREVVRRTIKFETPNRLSRAFPGKWKADFFFIDMNPSPDGRPPGGKGTDEWGSVWDNVGVSNLGEVKDYPLKDWGDFDKLRIPDIQDNKRFESVKGARERAGDKFVLGSGISLFERVHFIRGLNNTWLDLYDEPDKLGKLIDILVEMNIEVIKRYADESIDGYIWPDDWGLQNRLMISPEKWREIWKPRYQRVYEAAHDYGIFTFLHSCGYIVDILDDFIEIGLDVIHMDQQMNMGLDILSKRFKGRVTFFAPVDIQAVMPKNDLEEIRAYCRDIVAKLGSKEGGFLPCFYTDPIAVGHSPEAVDAMCEEFIKISDEMYGKK